MLQINGYLLKKKVNQFHHFLKNIAIAVKKKKNIHTFLVILKIYKSLKYTLVTILHMFE